VFLHLLYLRFDHQLFLEKFLSKIFDWRKHISIRNKPWCKHNKRFAESCFFVFSTSEKKLAGVVQSATYICVLHKVVRSFHSGRWMLCPWPSYPCGNNNNSVLLFHLSTTRNVHNHNLGPHWEIPNWASQIVKAFDLTHNQKIQNSIYSDNNELYIKVLFYLQVYLHVTSSSESSTFTIAHRWEKYLWSCPEIRTSYPSSSKRSMLNVLAIPQSTYYWKHCFSIVN
jgi:hypothetical protein